MVKICQAQFYHKRIMFIHYTYCFGPLSKTHIPVAIYAGVLGRTVLKDTMTVIVSKSVFLIMNRESYFHDSEAGVEDKGAIGEKPSFCREKL